MKRYTLCDVIKENSNLNNKGITFISRDDNEKFLSYSELYKIATLRLYDLQLRGVQQGHELVFQIDNVEDYILIFWACILGKIVPVPLTVSNNEEHIIKVFNVWNILHNPHLIIDTESFKTLEKSSIGRNIKFDEIKKNTLLLEEMINEENSGIIFDPQPEDIACIQFSSGSTGDPKGVTLTHANLMSNTKAIAKCMTKEDVSLNWMPLTHAMGLVMYHLTSTVRGINQYIMETNSFIGNPIRWIRKAHEHKVSILYSPNFGYKHFLAFYEQSTVMNWDLSHIRIIMNAAEPISAETCNKFLNTLAKYGLKRTAMIPLYGLSETSVAVSYHPVGKGYGSVCVDRRNLSIGENVIEIDKNDVNGITFVKIGPAVDDCEIRICDDKNEVLSDSKIGYIQVRGKNVTAGYYNNQEATAKAMTDDGWLNTGDLGFIRKGILVITGRSKDLIIVDGKNIYPHDIDRVVEDIEGVEYGGVVSVGVYDEDLATEKIVIFILSKGTVEDFLPMAIKIQKHVGIKMGLEVKEVLPIKIIPKTESGKIQRYKIFAMFRNGEFDTVSKQLKQLINQYNEENKSDTAVSILENELLKIFLRVLSTRKIGVNDNFMEFGISSIMLTQIAEMIEDSYPGKVKVQDLFAYSTVSKLGKFIESYGDFEIPGLKLPQDYFINEKNSKITDLFEFQLKGALNNGIKSISEVENIDVGDFLLATYIYLLVLTSKEREFYIQVMLNKANEVTSIKIKSEQIKTGLGDFFKLITEIGKLRENSKSYAIEKIQHTKLKRDGNIVIPLFYNKSLLDHNIDLIDAFDMIMEVDLKGAEVSLLLLFKALKKEKMKVLVHNYVKIIRSMVDYLSTEVTEVG